MKRGDVILITVPFSDLTSAKVRPALIVSPVAQSEEDIVVALITTTIIRSLQPSDLALRTIDREFGATGLRFDSVFRMSKLFNLNKTLAQRKLGNASCESFQKSKKPFFSDRGL
jgi:mRNA interferase MazF